MAALRVGMVHTTRTVIQRRIPNWRLESRRLKSLRYDVAGSRTDPTIH
jgi:hypothetical protein